MKTVQVFDIYMKSKIFSPETLRKLEELRDSFASMHAEFPASALEINEYLLSLKNNKEITLNRKRAQLKAIYKYMDVTYDFPDPFKKVMKIKIPREKRRYFTPDELQKIILAAHEGIERALILLLLDSPCRIGELGQHQLKGGRVYPGLRTDMLNNLNHTMNVTGKTGEHSYRLDPHLFELMTTLAAPNGQVFVSAKHPEGMTTKCLQELVRRIIARAGITGKKLGPHTLRHSAASLVAQKTNGNMLIIKALIQDTETKNAMVYVHDAEDNLKQTVSPLKMLGEEIIKNTTSKPAQLLLQSPSSDSTALVPTNQPIEKVEGTPDFSEELFPKIPENVRPIRPQLSANDLLCMREAFVYFASHNPMSYSTGHLTRLMKSMLRNINTVRKPND